MNIISKILIRVSSDLIGEDQCSNKYYRKNKTEKRFVIFNSKVKSCKITHIWNALLNKIINKLILKRKKEDKWQKVHLPNLKRTAFAVKPQERLLDRGFRQNQQLISNHGHLENNYEI